MTLAYLSLGSNLGDRRAQLAAGLAGLEAGGVRILRRSSFYETEPVGLADQPWFLNLVVEVETGLSADALLALVQQVEASQQRTRAVHWGPRTLDIDILLYGNEAIVTDRVQIPHPAMAGRRFVLQPLAELQPDLILPDGRSVRQLLDSLGPGQVVRPAASR